MTLTKQQHDQLCEGYTLREVDIHPGNFIPAVAKMARTVSLVELQNPTLLERLYRNKERAQQKLSEALGVEADVKATAERVFERTSQKILELELTPVYNLPTLDPSFLEWRLPSGDPGYSIYSLDNPECKIEFRSTTWRPSAESLKVIASPVLPPVIRQHYINPRLLKTIAAECVSDNLSSLTLSAHYTGTMPDHVRAHIRYYIDPDSGAPRFEKIFIIAEAPAWNRKGVAQIRVGDPLVVGVAKGLLWLIDSYDLTSMEELALSLCRSDRDHQVN